MGARYCSRRDCSGWDNNTPCPVAGDCFLFQWDVKRERERMEIMPHEHSILGDKNANLGEKPERQTTHTPTEAEEQERLFEWCKLNDIPMIHIPNERKCSAAVAAALIRQGMQKGFPDNFIPIAAGKYHGLFIELKRSKRSLSRKSPEQRAWVDRLSKQGYKAMFCYGASEAEKAISEYLKLK